MIEWSVCFSGRSRAELAEAAKDKNLLGYFDIRVGNEPDDRLLQFIGTNLPRALPRARARFDEHKDIIRTYAADALDYETFRLALGVPEED